VADTVIGSGALGGVRFALPQFGVNATASIIFVLAVAFILLA
jgi:hypothetical protein